MLSLASCDNISEEDRLIPIEREHSEKVVLLEEFTGARCVNCPNAATVVHNMLESEAYADNLVAVSLYPSQMEGNTFPINVDLRTPEATELFAAYNGVSAGLPCAMIDRTPYNGQVLQTNTALWSTIVNDAMARAAADEKPPVSIELSSTYDPSTRLLTVDYEVTVVDPVAEECNMQLYLTENNITSIQLSLTGPILDYTNNHVLRRAINGTWGTSIGANLTPGTVLTGSHSVTLEQDWKEADMQVVGFVYRSSDRHVHQAALLKSIIGE